MADIQWEGTSGRMYRYWIQSKRGCHEENEKLRFRLLNKEMKTE